MSEEITQIPKQCIKVHNILRLSPNICKNMYQRPIDIKIDEIRKRLSTMIAVLPKKSQSVDRTDNHKKLQLDLKENNICVRTIVPPKQIIDSNLPIIKKQYKRVNPSAEKEINSHADSFISKVKTQFNELNESKQNASKDSKSQEPSPTHQNITDKNKQFLRRQKQKTHSDKTLSIQKREEEYVLKSCRKTEELQQIFETNTQKKFERKDKKKCQTNLSQPNLFNHFSEKTRIQQLIHNRQINFRKKNNQILLHPKLKIKKNSLKIIQTTNSHKDFVSFVSLCNGFYYSNKGPMTYFVGKGNNPDLIRRALKKRGWLETNIMEDANLVWTQKKNSPFLQKMDTLTLTETSIKSTKIKMNYLFENKFQNFNEASLTQDLKLLTEGQTLFIIKENGNEEIKSKIKKISFALESILTVEGSPKIQIHNHFSNNNQIAYKQSLFWNMKQFYEKKGVDPFQHIPITFHVKNINDQQWERFRQIYFKEQKRGKFWIVKPAENTNRGIGICVKQTLEDIQSFICEKQMQKPENSFIIQQYLMPLLYNKRKFDIRCYMTVTIVNKKLRAYWFEEGYGRTCCKLFSSKNLKNKYIHLTNDAIQKNSEDYGKYQPGNKLSFEEMSKYIEKSQHSFSFKSDIEPQMRKLAYESIAATASKLHTTKNNFSFEIFGLDFMIDEFGKVWLIEVNRNPCLETSTSLLCRLLSNMIDDAFRIALDPLFPVDEAVKNGKILDSEVFESNKFRLIFEKLLQE